MHDKMRQIKRGTPCMHANAVRKTTRKGGDTIQNFLHLCPHGGEYYLTDRWLFAPGRACLTLHSLPNPPQTQPSNLHSSRLHSPCTPRAVNSPRHPLRRATLSDASPRPAHCVRGTHSKRPPGPPLEANKPPGPEAAKPPGSRRLAIKPPTQRPPSPRPPGSMRLAIC